MDSSRKFWEKIYLENAPKLIGVCRRYVVNPELAEDLVHDAFLKAIDKQSTYKGKGNFEGWLRQIVVNTALMYLRNEKTHKERRIVEINEKIDFAETTENESGKSIIDEAQFTDNDLLEAIDALPLHHKMVFNLYVIDNFSHKQIAQQLNISEGTSKSHLARARKKVQHILYKKATLQKKEKALIAVLFPALVKANPIDSLFKSRMRDFCLSAGRGGWWARCLDGNWRTNVLFTPHFGAFYEKKISPHLRFKVELNYRWVATKGIQFSQDNFSGFIQSPHPQGSPNPIFSDGMLMERKLMSLGFRRLTFP